MSLHIFALAVMYSIDINIYDLLLPLILIEPFISITFTEDQ